MAVIQRANTPIFRTKPPKQIATLNMKEKARITTITLNTVIRISVKDISVKFVFIDVTLLNFYVFNITYKSRDVKKKFQNYRKFINLSFPSTKISTIDLLLKSTR